jgi:benzoate/toluate 1,2-dioxygenase subunit beta
VSESLRRQIEDFVYLEARLADESRYADWEELVTDDFHYWVPNGRADYDPATRLSYLNDNRARLATRIRQLETGLRHGQTPVSPLCRVVSNIEVIEDGDEVTVKTNQIVYEVNAQSTSMLRLWPGHVTFRLRLVDGRWRMAAKTVELLIPGDALPNLTFLI